MHKGYRPGSHSAKRHEDPHVVVSTHLSDGGSNKAMHAATSLLGKGITQGDSSAHALLALTPSHRTSPANKHKPMYACSRESQASRRLVSLAAHNSPSASSRMLAEPQQGLVPHGPSILPL